MTQHKIVLTGPMCAGKSFLRRHLEDRGLRCAISHTTRPPRPGERDSTDYYFVDEGTFAEMSRGGALVEEDTFNGWRYGTSVAEFHRADFLILTPSGIRTLAAKLGRESLRVIYLTATVPVLEARMAERGDDPREWARRKITDFNDFDGFKEYDVRVNVRTEGALMWLLDIGDAPRSRGDE